MTTPAYDIGDLRRFEVTFTDINDVAADPTTITFKIREPDGTVTTYVYGTNSELVKDATGKYHVDWTVAKAGRHIVRWEGDGSLITAEEAEFYAKLQGVA